MRILVFGPNAGVSISTGGGSNFTLKLARFLVEEGHSVVLAGFHALSLRELESLHGIELPGSPGALKLERAPTSDRAYRLSTRSPLRLSPYIALTSPSFDKWIRRVISARPYELIVFQDDVPRAASAFVRDVSAYLYCHYPFRARKARDLTSWSLDQSPLAAAGHRVLDLAVARALAPDPGETVEVTWTNSTMTLRAIQAVWPRARPVYLPTYVERLSPEPEEVTARTRGSVIALGSIQRSKNYRTLLEAFRAVSEGPPSRRLTIVGGVRDPLELARLRRTIRRHQLGDRVDIVTDADHSAVRAHLDRSEVIVHAAVAEPFGLALLEGMAHGCAAVCHEGERSGGWTDILDRGTYGRGYASAPDLEETLGRILEDEREIARLSALALGRAGSFSRARFAENLRGYFH